MEGFDGYRIWRTENRNFNSNTQVPLSCCQKIWTSGQQQFGGNGIVNPGTFNTGMVNTGMMNPGNLDMSGQVKRRLFANIFHMGNQNNTSSLVLHPVSR